MKERMVSTDIIVAALARAREVMTIQGIPLEWAALATGIVGGELAAMMEQADSTFTAADSAAMCEAVIVAGRKLRRQE